MYSAAKTRFRSTNVAAEVDSAFAFWPGTNAPGVAVAIVHGGQLVHEATYGLANLETRSAIRSSTPFHLASLTKQFTALAVAILNKQGKLSYDDPASRFLPDFRAGTRQLTIRNLLNHTSGLQDYEDVFREMGQIRAEPELTGPELNAGDVVRVLSDRPLRFAPGDEWEYSNSGYVFLAEIIQRVSGQSFAEFLTHNFFRPLGMEDSNLYGEVGREKRETTTAYELKDHEYRKLHYSNLETIYGAEGMHSTLNDMVNWCGALGNDKLIDLSALRDCFQTGKLNAGANAGYGFGWFTARALGLRFVSHTGSCTGFRNFVVYYPDESLAIIVFSNFAEFDDLARSATACRLAKTFLGEKMYSPVEFKVDNSPLRRYAGEYQADTGERVRITVDGKRLLVTPSTLFPITLVPESHVKFFVEGAEGDTYFFNEEEQERVTGVTRHLSLFGYSRDAYTSFVKLS